MKKTEKKEKKEIMVMTSFGPVPYDVVKDYINSDVRNLIESFKSKLENHIADTIPVSITYYVNQLAKKNNVPFEEMDKFLEKLYNIDVSSVFRLILREIAIEIDKKYKDHIEDSEKIYSVGLTNGRIFELDKKHIRNYRNFAAFRTPGDAKAACKLTRVLLREMFKSGK